jgi:rod shape determining protein RodA
VSAVTTPTRRSADLGGRHRDLRSPLRFADYPLLIVTLAIACFGLAVNYAATWRQLEFEGEDPGYYLRRQAVFVAVGAVVMVAVAFVDYRFYRHVAREGYMLLLLLLAAVLVVGSEVNAARAWFSFGSFQLQPSEFGKIVVIVALAAFLARFDGRVGLHGFFTAIGIVALPMGLIFLQPDLGTMLVYLAVVMGVLLVAGAKLLHIGFATLALVIGVGFVLVADDALGIDLLNEAQESRLTAFVDRDSVDEDVRFNLDQSETAIGAGGLTGRGFLEGTQTGLSWVPEQETDFIFTAVAEEFGFLGAGALLAAYAFLLFRVWLAARLSADLFGTLAAVGVMSMVLFQVFENVGMTMGIMPVTGIPLPFLSHGGSSTVAAFAAVGLVLNVRARRYAP